MRRYAYIMGDLKSRIRNDTIPKIMSSLNEEISTENDYMLLEENGCKNSYDVKHNNTPKSNLM